MRRDWALQHRHEYDPKSVPQRWCGQIEHNLIRADGWNEESGSRIVFDCRRFLYLNLQASDLIAAAEQAHRVSGHDWQALCGHLPTGALNGPVTGRVLWQNAARDADYFQTFEALRRELERIAFEQVHLIKGDTQHDQRLACLGFPSI